MDNSSMQLQMKPLTAATAAKYLATLYHDSSQTATLQHAECRQDSPKPGHVRVANISVKRCQCVAYVPQADGIVSAT